MPPPPDERPRLDKPESQADIQLTADESHSTSAGPPLRRTDLREAVTAATRTYDTGLPVADLPAASLAGTRFGRYQIVRLLGQGGMGAVYEARQEKPQRTVALKMIRPDLASGSLLRRFEHESEVLGRLQHPGIAQIYEAGTVDTGDRRGPTPFFAMELVQGRTLTAHTAAAGLGVRARVGLMIKVCDAVQHAHQKGVIHRDLKPGNILVDSTGQPKVLDFGVARLTASDVHATMQTEMGQIVGTLSYMSPEQASGDPGELDTRSDVYALGVICFELLAGRLPHELQGKPVLEVLRLIREGEATRLSAVDRSLRGDLETIVAKALDNDRTRRYQSAGDLGADLSRYLNNEPVAARPATTFYQLRKFARRNRALVAGVGATAIAITGGFVATAVALARETEARTAESKQRTEAEKQRDRAVDAENETRRLLAQSHAESARLARRQGNWKAVIENVDRAVELGIPEPVPLLMLKIQATAEASPLTLQKTLDAIEARPDAAPFRGSLRLWRLMAKVPDAIDQHRRRLEEVLADETLTGVDRLYARSCAAATIEESVALAREALETDPFDSRLSNHLFIAFGALGRHQESLSLIEARLLLEPHNSDLLCNAAQISSMLGRIAVAERYLERARPFLTAERADLFRQITHVFGTALPEVIEKSELGLADRMDIVRASLPLARAGLSMSGPGNAAALTGLSGGIQLGSVVFREAIGAQLESLSPLLSPAARLKASVRAFALAPGPVTAQNLGTSRERVNDLRGAVQAYGPLVDQDSDPAMRRRAAFSCVANTAELARDAPDEPSRKQLVEELRGWLRRLGSLPGLNPAYAAVLVKYGVLYDDPMSVETGLHYWAHNPARPGIDYAKAAALHSKVPLEALFLAETALRQKPASKKALALREKTLAAVRASAEKQAEFRRILEMIESRGMLLQPAKPPEGPAQAPEAPANEAPPAR